MRAAQVVLDIQTQALDSAYTYLVPDDLQGVEVGCAVLVEFGARKAVGYVMALRELADDDPLLNPAAASTQTPDIGRVHFVDDIRGVDPPSQPKGPLKALQAVVSPSYFDEEGAALATFIAHEYIAPLSSCIHLLTPIGRTPKVARVGSDWELVLPAKRRKKKGAAADVLSDGQIAQRALQLENFELTAGQTEALGVVQACMAQHRGDVVVMDGVTGSGKTEVYLRAIRSALEAGQGTIVLVPEIALTPQTVRRFESRFGETVAVMHSRMTGAQRYDQWEAVRLGEKRVVVGARSALFCPMRNLGLVIIDEEHESTYKQESAPRYHARDVAAWMMRRSGGTLVLGSATPSIESLCRCKADPAWHRVVMPQRANGRPMPDVQVVDMAREFKSGSRAMFSKDLVERMFAAFDENRKVVLMLNQRGFATFLLCRECGYVPECPTCSVSLTYHDHGNKLVCHHCGRQQIAPPVCPVCGSPYLKKFGAGTQRVESELVKLLADRPQVRIIRMDSDTTTSRDAHERLLEEFSQPGAAVLLGTQMIAKGLDFDDVVLVGVINADTQLRLPDFRSAERTFDLVEQVAGRAGRGALEGAVLIQTYMPEACAVVSAATYDRRRFLADELPKRKLLGYPPYMRLANVLVWGPQRGDVQTVAEELAGRINERIRDFGGAGWHCLGAAPCALEKLRNNYRWHILVKAPPDADISWVVEPVIRQRKAHKTVNVACDVDPFDLM